MTSCWPPPPERIDPGNPTDGLHNTPKVVGGIDEPSTRAVAAFFGAFVKEVAEVPGCGEAELTKILENTFRHVNIALVNEITMFAHGLHIDVNAAIDAGRKAVNGSRILVLGVSYKPNVGDTRETPARPIIEQLAALGAELTIVDRYAAARSAAFADHDLQSELEPDHLATCDLALILTDHDDVDYAEVARRAPRVLDTRARIAPRPDNVERI